MTISVVVVEGLRDRVVVQRLLREAHGWREVAGKTDAHRALARLPAYSGLSLLEKDGRQCAILPHSRDDRQKAAVKLLREHNQGGGGQRWTRLLVVSDADLRSSQHPSEEQLRSAKKGLFESVFGALHVHPLDDWQEVRLDVPDTEPVEQLSVHVRALVLPAPGRAGCLEDVLLDSLRKESHSELINRVDSLVADVQQLDGHDEYRAEHPSKYIVGAALEFVCPDQRHEPLERKYAAIPWERHATVREALAPLSDL